MKKILIIFIMLFATSSFGSPGFKPKESIDPVNPICSDAITKNCRLNLRMDIDFCDKAKKWVQVKIGKVIYFILGDR